MITKRQMGLAMPQALRAGRIDTWYEPLVDAMRGSFIMSDVRVQMFLANIAQETGQLQAREENLHYSGERLLQVFPSLFSGLAQAEMVAAGGPEAVGNFIYDDARRPSSADLGNDHVGDGYKYRGRGPEMLTGADNYEAFFRRNGLPPDTNPDVLLEPKMGALSAAQYWEDHGGNKMADAGDFYRAVVMVNGGTNGYAERKEYLKRFQDAMANPDPVSTPTYIAPPAAPPVPPVALNQLLPPALSPVEPMAPVPPPGFSVAASGNVIRDDVKTSPIVKDSDMARNVSVVAGAAAVVAPVAGSVAGMNWQALAAFAAVILAAALAFAIYKLVKIKEARIEMNRKGIA